MNSSDADRDPLAKAAEHHSKNCADYKDDPKSEELRQAYLAGAQDAAAMLDAEEAGEEGLPGAAQGKPTDQEVAQLLDEMVASDEIDADTAADLLERHVIGKNKISEE